MIVILPVYIANEELLQLTKNTIESLGDVGLVIIDNASPLGGGYLRSVAEIYVRGKENFGYAKAVNQGLSLIHNDIVAIANNDIRVSPNWLTVTQEVFEEPDVYSCHFRMTDYDVPFQYGNTIASMGKERWCTSSFFVIKTRDEKGNLRKFYYDENFINSYDDWDIHYRIRDAGLKTAYTDKACYQHHHSSTQQIIPNREEQNIKNREYFKKKHGSYPEDLFAIQFEDQMKQEYWKGFQL